MATKSIAELILEVAADEEHRNDISLLPLMCGTGKSTAISEIIGRTIRLADQTGNGLLVITDRIDRLNDYLNPRDRELKDYLQENQDRITIVTRENASEAFASQRQCPVLMMTTQRYMNLSPKTVNALLKWEKGRRPLVLIDERPEILTPVMMSDLDFSECETALRETGVDTDYVSEWHEAFLSVNKLIGMLPDYPDGVFDFAQNMYFSAEIAKKAIKSIYRYAYFFCRPNYSKYNEHTGMKIEGLDELDQDYKKRLNDINNFSPQRGYINIYTRLTALLQMAYECGLYSRYQVSVTKGAPLFVTALSTLLDRYNVIKETKAKTIILDGTGDLSPEYEIHSFDVRDTAQTGDNGQPVYTRTLSRMTIRIIDYPTSRARFRNPEARKEIIEMLRAYIHTEKIQDPHMALFTYMLMEKSFTELFNRYHIEHFGDIVGKNQFNRARNIFQIGINRFPDTIYFLYYLAFHPAQKARFENVLGKERIDDYYTNDSMREIREITPDTPDEEVEYSYHVENTDDMLESMIQQTKQIQSIMQEQEGEARRIMSRIMLAELEQNIFRGIIRNADCDEDYTYHLFMNVGQYPELIKMIHERYEKLGATVVDMKLPPEILAIKKLQRKTKTGRPGYESAIMQWHDNVLSNGEEYTPSMIREACGFKNIKVYEQVLHRSEFLRGKMKNEQVRRGVYVKKGSWL